MSIPPNDEHVHRVRYTMTPRGQAAYYYYTSDLIFADGEALVVIERPNGDGVALSLDPRKLHHFDGQDYDYFYEDVIVDPRPFD